MWLFRKKKKGNDLSELKRELQLDEHSVPIDELYRRYCSDPNKVQVYVLFVIPTDLHVLSSQRIYMFI